MFDIIKEMFIRRSGRAVKYDWQNSVTIINKYEWKNKQVFISRGKIHAWNALT